MNVRYIARDDYDRELKTRRGTDVGYYSRKEMKRKFPRGGYITVGCIGARLRKPAGHLVTEDGEEIYYTLHYPKFCYGVDGYMACGNRQYVAVLKNRLARNLLLTLAALLLAVGLAVGIFYILNRGGTDLDPNAKNYEPDFEYSENTDPDHIAIPGYEEIRMEAGTDTAYVALWNPPANPCYFKFQICQGDEVLYESGLIEPGKAVTEIQFDRTFQEGTYDIVINISTFSLDDPEKPMNGGSVECKLTAYVQ